MSTSQYYVVGNNDVWMIQFKDTKMVSTRAATRRSHSRIAQTHPSRSRIGGG
jgi:hypothetical protein